MASMKIKKGDNVQVIAGKEKGSTGKVLATNPKEGTVIVEGVNIITKHTKPSAANQQGGIVRREAPIDASNVMLLAGGKPSRVGYVVEDGKKYRVAKATGEKLDVVKDYTKGGSDK